jgi:REP element-mobilizing transposase RayT
VLTQGDAADTITSAFGFQVEHSLMVIGAFVVMPDHWHLLMALPWEEGEPEPSLSAALQRCGSWIGHHTRETLAKVGAEWQEGFYDTRIRSARQFRYVLNYIEANPVEKGLVARREEWPWSSADPRWRHLLARPWPWGFEQDPAGGS